MKRALYLLVLVLMTKVSTAQLKVTPLNRTSVPKTIKFTGHIINSARYVDNDGEHIIITTETGIQTSKTSEDDFRNAELYAYNYLITGDIYKLTWQTYDFIKDCSLDLTVSYLPNTFAVTDLDNNGKAEVWLMYKTACTGDVSPSDMKIIMHEGTKKYAVRGTNKIKFPGLEEEGGKYTFDEAFKAGPQLFREYAMALWKKNLLENWK